MRLYAKERLRAGMDGATDLFHEVEFVGELYLETDMQFDLKDFYFLHCAYEDLKTREIQYYWPDADRSNIEAIITQRVEEFVNG